MAACSLSVTTDTQIPEAPNLEQVIHLEPTRTFDTKINVRDWAGWITSEEHRQAIQGATVGIAGCGGMGGQIGLNLLRAGVGCIKLADVETFDSSNINRQAGATEGTVGKSKLLETLKLARGIRSDTTIIGYPMGINANSVEHFAAGCDLIIAEIELFVLDEMIRLHQVARQANIPIMDGLVVGFGTNFFLYDHSPACMNLETLLGWGDVPEHAVINAVQTAMAAAETSEAGMKALVSRILDAYVPNLASYRTDSRDYNAVLASMLAKTAPIVGITPPFATGFAGIQAYLMLLEKYCGENQRPRPVLPPTPSFISLDAFRGQATVVERTTVTQKTWYQP